MNDLTNQASDVRVVHTYTASHVVFPSVPGRDAVPPLTETFYLRPKHYPNTVLAVESDDEKLTTLELKSYTPFKREQLWMFVPSKNLPARGLLINVDTASTLSVHDGAFTCQFLYDRSDEQQLLFEYSMPNGHWTHFWSGKKFKYTTGCGTKSGRAEADQVVERYDFDIVWAADVGRALAAKNIHWSNTNLYDPLDPV